MQTKQEIFNYVYLNLVQQGGPSKNCNGNCLYRDVESGRKCAVGWLLDDERYEKSFENRTLDASNDVQKAVRDSLGINQHQLNKLFHFLRRLQEIHDDVTHSFRTHNNSFVWTEKFHKSMKYLASEYDLEIPKQILEGA